MAEFPFRSQRDWIEFLEERGQLVHNKEGVDLRMELTAIAYRLAREKGPAVLHENIRGYPGWRIFSEGLGTRQRIAWALGLEDPAGIAARLQEIKKKTLKPVEVSTAPCKGVKIFGDDVDLVRIPVPQNTHSDIPPLMSSVFYINRDPETGWHNLMYMRCQPVGKMEAACKTEAHQHAGMIFQKYARENKPCPVAVVNGSDPLLCLCAMTPAPVQFDEWDYWGGMTGEPLQVVKTETSDLLIPANAEIVIEGEWDPVERVLEGPMAEMPGFSTTLRNAFSMKVKAITMRRNPIYQFFAVGKGPTEAHQTYFQMYASEAYFAGKQLCPQIMDVALHSMFTMVISIDKAAKKKMSGLACTAALAVRSTKIGPGVKNIIVVDDELDPHNIDDVLWALSVYFQGSKDITVIPDMTGALVDPSGLWASSALGLNEETHSSFTILDCTEPPAPYDEGYKRGIARPESKITKMVDEKWSKYGF